MSDSKRRIKALKKEISLLRLKADEDLYEKYQELVRDHQELRRQNNERGEELQAMEAENSILKDRLESTMTEASRIGLQYTFTKDSLLGKDIENNNLNYMYFKQSKLNDKLFDQYKLAADQKKKISFQHNRLVKVLDEKTNELKKLKQEYDNLLKEEELKPINNQELNMAFVKLDEFDSLSKRELNLVKKVLNKYRKRIIDKIKNRETTRVITEEESESSDSSDDELPNRERQILDERILQKKNAKTNEQAKSIVKEPNLESYEPLNSPKQDDNDTANENENDKENELSKSVLEEKLNNLFNIKKKKKRRKKSTKATEPNNSEDKVLKQVMVFDKKENSMVLKEQMVSKSSEDLLNNNRKKRKANSVSLMKQFAASSKGFKQPKLKLNR
jgi:hypothetical protein